MNIYSKEALEIAEERLFRMQKSAMSADDGISLKLGADAIEKQIAKPMAINGICPACHRQVEKDIEKRYCPYCGQKMAIKNKE